MSAELPRLPAPLANAANAANAATNAAPAETARALIARRLPRLRRVCGGALAGLLVLSAAGPVLLAPVLAPAERPRAPGDLPLILSILATVLILVASRLQQAILRRAAPRPQAKVGVASVPRRHAPELEGDPAALVAYGRATLVSYAVLEVAGLLGVAIALVTGERRYAWVLGLAAAAAMLVRWPTRGAMLRFLGLRPF